MMSQRQRRNNRPGFVGRYPSGQRTCAVGGQDRHQLDNLVCGFMRAEHDFRDAGARCTGNIKHAVPLRVSNLDTFGAKRKLGVRNRSFALGNALQQR